MKILLCFGTRPEAIKVAPIYYELKKRGLDFKVCVTAQHREMLDQVLEFFEIVPDYDLDLMQAGQSLNSLSARILKELDQVLYEAGPDIILVQGDTTTAFMAALAAFHRGIEIGHIEAGLRTLNLKSPFPEEANRQLIGRIADFHFCPTETSRENLLKEGINNSKIYFTHNTGIDALQSAEIKLLNGYTNEEIENCKAILQEEKKLILITGHRRENFGKGLVAVCKALYKIAQRPDVQLIFPVHLNPKVKTPVHKLLGSCSNIHLIEPVGYPAFVWLMMQSSLIISDSGGVQEEAPGLKKPVIVTRETTERMEAVTAGFSHLAGTSNKKIVGLAEKLLVEKPDYSKKANPFGDGKAAERIVGILTDSFLQLY